MKKGFTLIELLAVIVILAIIALIATPIVLNIINDTKESAVVRSAEFYLDAVELSIAQRILEGHSLPDGTFPIMEDGNICIKLGTDKCEDIMTVEVSKGAPTSGTIAFGEGQVAGVINLVIDNSYLYMNNEGNIEHMVYTDENCFDTVDATEVLYDDYGYIPAGNSVAIVGYNDLPSCGTDVIVPRTINGKTVVGISWGGLGYQEESGIDKLTSIILPDTLEQLKGGGVGFNSLTSIILPSSLIGIGDNAVTGNNLTEIYLNEGLKEIGFWGLSELDLTKITIPSTVENISVGELPKLTTVINRTGKPFNWSYSLTNEQKYVEAEGFVYGTVRRSDGSTISVIKG